MMDKLVSSYQDTEFRGIELEVDKDNTNAYLFYLINLRLVAVVIYNFPVIDLVYLNN